MREYSSAPLSLLLPVLLLLTRAACNLHSEGHDAAAHVFRTAHSGTATGQREEKRERVPLIRPSSSQERSRVLREDGPNNLEKRQRRSPAASIRSRKPVPLTRPSSSQERTRVLRESPTADVSSLGSTEGHDFAGFHLETGLRAVFGERAESEVGLQRITLERGPDDDVIESATSANDSTAGSGNASTGNGTTGGADEDAQKTNATSPDNELSSRLQPKNDMAIAGIVTQEKAAFHSDSGLFPRGSLCYSCRNLPPQAKLGSGQCQSMCVGQCCELSWAVVGPGGGYVEGSCYSGECNSARGYAAMSRNVVLGVVSLCMVLLW